jgi:hypothetical protein
MDKLEDCMAVRIVSLELCGDHNISHGSKLSSTLNFTYYPFQDVMPILLRSRTSVKSNVFNREP